MVPVHKKVNIYSFMQGCKPMIVVRDTLNETLAHLCASRFLGEADEATVAASSGACQGLGVILEMDFKKRRNRSLHPLAATH